MQYRDLLITFSTASVLALTPLFAASLPQRDTSGQTRQPACSHKFGVEEVPTKSANTIRLATYNILNFFDHEDDPTLSGEFDDIKNPVADDRAEKLAEVIRELDADVLALQEVESKEALEWFRDQYLSEMGYKYISSIEVGFYRGIENAVLSRYRIVNERVWPDESLDDVNREGVGWDDVPRDEQSGLEFQRSPLMVDIVTDDGYRFTLFSVHHKSGNHKYHREAEALQLIEYLDKMHKRNPSRNIAVLGDFNTAPWDKSMRVYRKSGLIDTLSYRTTWSRDPECPQYKTHSSDRVLDYILLNPAMYRELKPGSGFVYGGELTPPESYNWKTDPHPPGYASDHYPVAIDLVKSNVSG